MLNKAAVDEDRDVALDASLRDAGALADAGHTVAGVAHDAGKDYALRGVEAFDGTDNAFVEADGQVAAEVFFLARGRRITRFYLARGRVFFLARRKRRNRRNCIFLGIAKCCENAKFTKIGFAGAKFFCLLLRYFFLGFF